MRIGIDATPLPQRPVGAGHYIIQLIRALQRQPGDEEFVIFAQRHSAPLLGIEETPRFRLHILPDQSPPRRLLWEQTAFLALARRLQLDVLHSLHYTLPIAYRGKRVVTLHDMTFFLYPRLHTLSKRYFFRFFIHLSGRLADALLADSESTRQDAVRLAGLRPEKITTTLLGVTPDFHPENDAQKLAAARQKYGLPERYFLYVGLIEPRKNVPSLLRAFASVAPALPQHQLVVVGRKGWMVAEVEQELQRLGIRERIHFTGYVDQPDLPLVYNMAEVFVYPSFYEGFGLPVLEAMACGTPVITTNVSSMPEITGEAGCLLAPTDTAGLSQAMLRLAESPEERRRMAEQGLQRAAAFTWDRTAAQTLAVYRQVAND